VAKNIHEAHQTRYPPEIYRVLQESLVYGSGTRVVALRRAKEGISDKTNGEVAIRKCSNRKK
jgi:hypothetical protein